MNPTHDWISLAAEGAGYACTVCMICTCHNADKVAEPCPGRAGHEL